MGEEHPSSKERVGFVAGQLLEPLEKSRIDAASTKLLNELGIVDSILFSICRDGSLYVPGSYDLGGGTIRRCSCRFPDGSLVKGSGNAVYGFGDWCQ